MSLRELAALARRHLIAVTMVLLVAAGTAYAFKHTPPTYTESATMTLVVPGGTPNGNALVTAAEVTANWIMGPQGRLQLQRAGVTQGFNVALVNFSNMEYPYYSVPYLAVSTSAQDPATAHQMFAVVRQTLYNYLAVHQRQEGVTPDNRISIGVFGDTGPLIQAGSRIRSFAGLLVLTIVVAYLVAAFLDRHPIRPRALLQSQWRGLRGAAPRDPRAMPTRHGAV